MTESLRHWIEWERWRAQVMRDVRKLGAGGWVVDTAPEQQNH